MFQNAALGAACRASFGKVQFIFQFHMCPSSCQVDNILQVRASQKCPTLLYPFLPSSSAPRSSLLSYEPVQVPSGSVLLWQCDVR
jgi:hypothetical protein